MIAMRDAFIDKLYEIASDDRRVILISADFGAPSLDRFRRDLSSQFINIGIAEQNMISVAAGLALGGKIVFCYAILPFVTLRCYEQIRVDLCCMNLPVTLVGVGAGYAYHDEGPTHHGLEDIAVMRTLPNMIILSASESEMAMAFAWIAYNTPGPKYIRLDRGNLPSYRLRLRGEGWREIRSGADLAIVATGYMVGQAMKVAESLAKHDVESRVIDLYRIKPFNEDLIDALTKEKSRRVVTLEEGFTDGGVGSIMAEALTDCGESLRLKRIGSPNQYCFQYGSRDEIHKLHGLDVDGITKTILEWLRRRK